ncbi:glycosyltransferase [Kitasatospora sp. NPDC057965]|uniref:glycosyltransferase n=1 Tax=Kitasatospora sp. NPDC057965 TaxID=3346291 RepID=UPI0036D8F77D
MPYTKTPAERAARLQRLLVTHPLGQAPSSQVITYTEADLARLWTGTPPLRPLIITIIGHGRNERLPLLFDAVGTAARALEPGAQPALVVCSSPDSRTDDACRTLSLAARSGIHDSVFHADRVPDDELSALLASADAYLSTARHTDAFLWKAMACGTPPIVLSDADAEQVIVQGGYDANGWVSDPYADDLAATLVQVCLHPAERLRRGAAAAARARAHKAGS